MTNLKKIRLAWKYRRHLWKRRELIRRRELFGWAAAGAVVVAAAALTWGRRSRSSRDNG